MHSFRTGLSSQERESKKVLDVNKNLQKKLLSLNRELSAKNDQLYNIETQLENLDIFEQHMTSLNLRCEFLQKQVNNLERKHKVKDDTYLFKPDDFNSKIEWRTTETTLDNLCTEFDYLKEQLTVVNGHIPKDSSFNDKSIISQHSDMRPTSIFSNSDLQPSMDEGYSSSEISLSTIKDTKRNPNDVQKEKKLLKMESFLNFNQNITPMQSKKEVEIYPLKGFKINTISENPLYDSTEKKTQNNKTIRGKASSKSMKKQLELIDLPPIDEGVDETFELFDDLRGNVQSEMIESDQDTYQDITISFDERQLRHHISLPNRSPGGISSDESLRHFVSDGAALNKRFLNDKLKHTEITDSLFSFDQTNTSNIKSRYKRKKRYSVNKTSINGSYSDIDPDEYNNYNEGLSDSDSTDSYGSENVTPLVFKKPSLMTLKQSKSHESIFSVDPKSAKQYPLREKNLDLKAQTMKWLKPNNPIVSSSAQPYTAFFNTFKDSTNVHEDMLNILNSNVNNLNISSPTCSDKTQVHEDVSKTPLINSWIPSKIFSTPISVPKLNNQASSINDDYTNDEPISSWIKSFIPNSTFMSGDVDTINNNDSETLPSESFLNRERQNGAGPQKTTKPIKLNRNILNERPTFNSSSSSLTIDRNGRRMVRHGYGSSFNQNSVVSSRVSYSALRDALANEP